MLFRLLLRWPFRWVWPERFCKCEFCVFPLGDTALVVDNLFCESFRSFTVRSISFCYVYSAALHVSVHTMKA